MDDLQVGEVIRQVRLRLGLSQAEVAARAGVSQTTVSMLERGQLEDVSLRAARSVCRALEIGLPVAPRWRGADLHRLLDARHAGLVSVLVVRLGALGWDCEPEHTFNLFGERGSVDVLALREQPPALLISEVKTRIVDEQEMLGTLNRKARVVPKALLRERGWRPEQVATVLVLPDTTGIRNAIERHAPVFDAALPARTIEVRRWLERPAGNLRGILFVPDIADSNGQRKPGRLGR